MGDINRIPLSLPSHLIFFVLPQMDLTERFKSYAENLSQVQAVRDELHEIVKKLNTVIREATVILQRIHRADGIARIPEISSELRTQIGTIRDILSKIKDQVQRQDYYRYHDHWKMGVQNAVFLLGMVEFLEKEQLISREEAADALALKVDGKEGFHLDLEDFLLGLLTMSKELSRFCVNCVTAGDYRWPVVISNFIIDLEMGFKLLNFKNDTLRRKYDALKYDLRKTEEILYDLTLRDLIPGKRTGDQPSSSAKTH